MWWSPDSRKLAYYRFDEKQVPDYYLQMNQTADPGHARRRGVSEAGQAESRSSTCSSTTSPRRRRRGSTCATASRSTTTSVGHYVYNVAWSPDGTRAAASTARTAGRTSSSSRPASPRPASAARSSARNGRPAGSRTARRCAFLKDGKRFIWESRAQRLEELLSLRSERAS